MPEYITKNGNVVAVQLGKERFALKKSLKFAELDKYSGAIDKVEEIVDFAGKAISEEKFAEFVQDMWPNTKAYLALLLVEGRWFTSAEIQKAMKIKPQGIAGIRAGLAKRAKSRGMDPVDEREWIFEEGQNKFRIKDRYREALRRALMI